MSDSVDRCFVHALATVRRLPRTGSSRPPPAARLRLYGLYKQSMEGDVDAILPRPSLPPNSPSPNDPPSNFNSVHRYASRDLRTRETQAEIEKWDAWHACAGMSRTEAKRRYITTLIETMKEYASGTSESRELVSELEFVWNQIKSQSGSDESEGGESPTRKLERAGMKDTRMMGSAARSGRDKESLDGGSGLFERNRNGDSDQLQTRPGYQQTRTVSGLRILSPISQHSSDGVVENEEVPPDEYEGDDDPDNHQDQSPYQTSPSSPVQANAPTSLLLDPWRGEIEAHLKQLSLELIALREQLSSQHLLSRSSFSSPYSSTYPANFSTFPFYRKLIFRLQLWLRWAFWTIIRQALIQAGFLLMLIIYGRIKGNRTIEVWVKGRFKKAGAWIGRRKLSQVLLEMVV